MGETGEGGGAETGGGGGSEFLQGQVGSRLHSRAGFLACRGPVQPQVLNCVRRGWGCRPSVLPPQASRPRVALRRQSTTCKVKQRETVCQSVTCLPKSSGSPRIASWLEAPLLLMATSRQQTQFPRVQGSTAPWGLPVSSAVACLSSSQWELPEGRGGGPFSSVSTKACGPAGTWQMFAEQVNSFSFNELVRALPFS